MTPGWLVAATLLAALALGVAERVRAGRSRRAVPIRIHVNGTRGKSTVTRLVWCALGEAGIPTLAKTTGTAPRLLLPDGTERPVIRRSPASIREQLWLLNQARRFGARALVAECMAVDPVLQWTSEHEMIGATIGVITNVRTDHRESMGRTLDEMAASLANTIPRGGLLVNGEAAFTPLFARRAAAIGTRVVEVGGAGRAPSAENEAIALAVCRELGIADEVARAGFARAPADPGDVTSGTLQLPAGPVHWIDATAANDPESFDWLAAATGGGSGEPAATAVVFNHRADRPLRLEAFAELSEVFRGARVLVVAGDRPAWTLWRRVSGARGRQAATRFVTRRRLTAELGALLAARDRVVERVAFAGNTKGMDVALLIAAAAAASDARLTGGLEHGR